MIRQQELDGWWGEGGKKQLRGFFESTGVRLTKRSKFHVGMGMQSRIYGVGGRHRHVVEEVQPRPVL